MTTISSDSWNPLRGRRPRYGELAAHAIGGREGLLLAIDEYGARHLLIPVASQADGTTDNRSRGLQAATRLLVVESMPESVFIDVLCVDASYWDVFDRVVSTILDLVAQGMSAADAVRRSLGHWRRFWSAPASTSLSEEETLGLFAELWFLAVWLVPQHLDSIVAWVGPTGARHDFQWPAIAVEAKATSSTRGRIHRIHGIEQLDAPEHGRLYLFSLRVRREDSADNTVMAVIEQITELLGEKPDMLDAFENRLVEAGYSTAHESEYADRRYRVIDDRLYQVDGNFPRLTPSTFVSGLPAGVERVEYEVNLDACPELVVATTPSDARPLLPLG